MEGAGPGDALHHRLQHGRLQPAGGQVVQEEEGPRPLAEDVVDTHGHQVLPYGGVDT